MKWIKLWNKIGKQPIKIIQNVDITVVVDGKEVNVTGLKFKQDGTPYLTT